MKRVIGLVFVSALFFLSCSEEDSTLDLNQNIEEAVSVQSMISARRFINSKEVIDVQIDQKDPQFTKNLTDIEVAKLKAAVYRFYSTVEVKNGNYYTNLESAEEINISKDLFKLFMDNLHEMNENINKIRSQGGQIIVQQVTSEYLDSLLK